MHLYDHKFCVYIIYIYIASAFWILFGTQDVINSDNSTSIIEDMDQFNKAAFILYSETFGNDVDRDVTIYYFYSILVHINMTKLSFIFFRK